MFIGHDPRTGICTDCARAIIQVGIISVTGPTVEFRGKGEQWEADMTLANELFEEAGVELHAYPFLYD